MNEVVMTTRQTDRLKIFIAHEISLPNFLAPLSHSNPPPPAHWNGIYMIIKTLNCGS